MAALFIPQILLADNSTKQESLEPVPVMPVVLVEAERITPTTGMVILDKEMIENHPVGNGSVNEIIGRVPGVQYNEDAGDSFTQGEITPPLVSISGSRFYDNNYTIDGISNNSPLDPASDTYADANKLPGYPQMHILNPQIIDQITVYNSNIPAEFGGFIGGQVDTITIEPDQFWGQIRYRTTRSDWTVFHVDPKKKDEFEHSNDTDAQPEFEKHEAGLTLSMPLGLDTGLLLSYQQLYSRIPLHNLEESATQTRKRENFFLKLSHYLPDNSKLTVTALASPTEAEYFSADFKDSDYTIKNANNSLIVQYDRQTDAGALNLGLGYTRQAIEREADPYRFYWSPATDAIDWESGKTGGLGDLKTDQQEINARASLAVNEFRIGATAHQVKIGAEASYSRQHYRRPETGYYYYSPVIDANVVCSPGDPGCIDNEQYLRRRAVYQAADSTAEVFDGAAYLQDVVSWKRLEVFPGLRLSYDDFTEEKNLAPRLSASLDLFGDRRTILFAGRNRYYSGTLLTQALYEPIETINQTRTGPGNSATDWTDSVVFRYRDRAVKTPYADEETIGLIQKVFGGEFKAQYINKTSKNELARERIDNPAPTPDVYLLNNFGRSEHESLQVSWQRSWKRHRIEINSTWQKTTTTHSDYDSTFSEDDLVETIWYDGEELLPHEIPRRDFNRPVIANLIYSCRLPYDVTFTNITRYRGAYWRLWNTVERKPSERFPDQSPDPFVYEKRKNKPVITFDWHLSWTIPSLVEQNVVLTIDLLNVFDKRSKIAYQSGTMGYDYEVGRQLWAGIEFNF